MPQAKTWAASAVTVKPVPEIQNQVGPTCGLTALSVVMKFWYKLLMARYQNSPMEQPISPLPAARDPKEMSGRERLMDEIRKAGGKPQPLKKSPLPTFLPTMQDIAEKMGSRIGEVAQANVLARIARQSGGFTAKVERWDDTHSMMELIKSHIDRNIPCIIAYDNTDSGDPGTGTLGDRAHWAVIFGYIDTLGTYEVLATHGWGYYYIWAAETLRASNEQLERYEAKAGTWVNIETGGTPAWNLRDKNAPESTFKWDSIGGQARDSTTTAYDLAETHKKPTLKVPNYQKGVYEFHKDPSVTARVRGFAGVDSAQDLKRQLVIVTPVGEADLTAPVSLGGAPPSTTTTGVGQHY